VAQPARDAPLVGMEEKIPILYYNTIDSDIREEEKNRAIQPPETSILKKRPPTLCFALVRSDRPQPFPFLFLPLSLRPTYLDIAPPPPPPPFLFLLHFFSQGALSERGEDRKKWERVLFSGLFISERKKKKGSSQTKKGKNICSPPKKGKNASLISFL
jgi:hypothetical protein